MYIIKKCERSDLGAESPHIKICRVPPAIISSTFSFHNCPYGESTPFPLPPPKRNIRHVKGRTIRKVMGGGEGKSIFAPSFPGSSCFPIWQEKTWGHGCHFPTERFQMTSHPPYQCYKTSCGHTIDFYQGKTDLPRANSSKISEINSYRFLFYLGKIFWEGHTTDIGSQGFHAQLNFLAPKFKKARCSGIQPIKETFFFLSRCYFLH